MQTYTDATIARCITTIANADAQQIARVIALRNEAIVKDTVKADSKAPTVTAKPAKRTVKPADAQDWRKNKPSRGQIARNRKALAEINRFERFLGHKPSTHASLNGGKVCKFTAGAYSDHLQNNLKPNLASLQQEARVLSSRD
jgi:hypothetical protein